MAVSSRSGGSDRDETAKAPEAGAFAVHLGYSRDQSATEVVAPVPKKRSEAISAPLLSASSFAHAICG